VLVWGFFRHRAGQPSTDTASMVIKEPSAVLPDRSSSIFFLFGIAGLLKFYSNALINLFVVFLHTVLLCCSAFISEAEGYLFSAQLH